MKEMNFFVDSEPGAFKGLFFNFEPELKAWKKIRG